MNAPPHGLEIEEKVVWKYEEIRHDQVQIVINKEKK